MTMISDALKAIDTTRDVLSKVQENEALKAHVGMMKDQLTFITMQLGKLEEHSELSRKEVEQLKDKIIKLEALNQFEHRHGMAWKKCESGKFHPYPYCPKCHLPLSTDTNFGVLCTVCNWIAPLSIGDVSRLLKSSDIDLEYKPTSEQWRRY